VETQVQAAERPVISRSIEGDLDSYLDAIAGATAIFREAVDVYLQTGPDGGCWRQAKRVAEHMRTLDELQQKLETGVRPGSVLGDVVLAMVDPTTGVSRLLKDMRRQITGFAIESGFSGPGRSVPASWFRRAGTDRRGLRGRGCAGRELSSIPAVLGTSVVDCDGERSVSWYENQADRLSMQLLKKLFADESLDLKSQLSLAQLVEEIDRVADQAEGIDQELRASRGAGLPAVRAKRFALIVRQPRVSGSSCPAAFARCFAPSPGFTCPGFGLLLQNKPIVLASHTAQSLDRPGPILARITGARSRPLGLLRSHFSLNTEWGQGPVELTMKIQE
jgi:hypothetical protein